MATQNIVKKILSDAQIEAQGIISNAEKRRDEILSKANVVALERQLQAQTNAEGYAKSTLEKRLADARLESSKIMLKEKRKVVDSVYALALQRLLSLEKEDCLALYSALLEKYAEPNDEVFLAKNFAYEQEFRVLPVIEKRGLTVSKDRIDIEGGMRLVGKLADKELSFTALLAADKERNQAELARKLFH
ncbi:MAG: hypothetical protein IKA72_01695 [Clostridia bacterium]|nr:hypothetical protein [Clostridia bacterium]